MLRTSSGLQYKIISDGTGESPKPGDEVQVKYTGRLIDGTVFDSTDKRGGQPARFKVGQVIPGWTEALQLMKKGSKWELYIPSQLAYGERATGAIPQNTTHICEVDLIEFTRVTNLKSEKANRNRLAFFLLQCGGDLLTKQTFCSFDHAVGGETMRLVEVFRNVRGLAEFAFHCEGFDLVRNASVR